MPVDHLARARTQERSTVEPEEPATGDAYDLELRWEEPVVSREGDRGVVLDPGWGVEPPVVHVPSAALWDGVAQPELLGRRSVTT